MKIPSLARIALAAVALTTASACLGVDNNVIDERQIEETTFNPSLGVDLAASTKTTNGAYYRDITVGAGPVIATGQMINVAYTGWLWTGTQFDTGTTSFHLGGSEVIAGFDEGLAGARVGGQRQIIIPPSLGYGPYDYFSIPGNSILVFKVDIISAQ